ncbi:hypothetical protein [Ancylobacter lacus]|uniref:hypothetical protein n=1 Tax=Ancylobacter lacus TaxID=2579970 RepID=UPI001BCF086E|nr:hypothetical protein [Ancylobacter lacus]
MRVLVRRECFSPGGCDHYCEPGEVIVNAYLAPASGEVRLLSEREAHFTPRDVDGKRPAMVLVCAKE